MPTSSGRQEQAFGLVLRELREARGLSQEQLANACDRDRTYVSLLERGRYSPSIRTLFQLAQALEVNASEIIRRVEEAISP
jgi:transcriptional regulator with XRE-family HTH domain